MNMSRPLKTGLALKLNALLPVPGKKSSDWAYAWIPVVGPLVGGLLAAGVNAWLTR